MIGVKAAQASHIEKRRYLPSLTVFFEIHRVTGAPLEQLQKFFIGGRRGNQNSDSRKGHRTKARPAG